jgi:hypothetical protein
MSAPADSRPVTVDLVSPPLFREVQHFRQWWIWVAVAGTTVLMWWMFIVQIVLGKPAGSRPAPDAVVWLFTLLFGVGFPLFFVALRVVTEVRPGNLRVGLAPFRRSVLLLSEVAGVEAVTYHPVRDFGGWGVRWAGARGKAYNAYGDRGVQLLMNDGHRLLIGSQRPDELLMAIRAASL